MELIIKHFNELTTLELMEIYKLRNAVFVVEQDCIYQDIDGADPHCYHLWLQDQEGIQAYLRVLPQNIKYADASLGRVISVKRRCGLATRLLQEGIALAREKFGAKRLVISAQEYACPVYEKVGFVRTDDKYLEDGIPHVRMVREETI
jgi:ElaA protein